MAKNSQVNVGIKFRSDTKDVENSLNKLKKSLQDLQKIKLSDFKGNAKDFDQMQQTAKKVQIALEKAFNPTLNTTNIKTFQSELQKTVGSVDQVYNKLKLAGPQGEVAFHQMATEILTTNLKLKQTNSLIDSMGKTMVNTVKWGIASSVMNTFTQSVQGAFQYVQSLEKSLTNIRIVTGDSTEKMAQFAEQANRSAQALGRSTLDYTKASLTFYQQGLNDEDVQARTEATLKAQNITGAGQQMADYLTSVWNGYKVANEEAELYVDKLAAVADTSASDMSQLAIAMSKVTSTANTMGVDIDQLNAQIATVVATTRQAPESVGTAFKTIYTRMNDIKTGSDEAEISLGRYSGTMASLGFNVLDTTGHLRDTGQVMEEIGGRWQDLTREQQIYLAQTMGGQRQVNQLMALFDNWTTYSELLNTSLESEGTLAEKNTRYMESLGAKMEQLGAAGERVKDALINENELKGGVQALTNLVNLMGNFIESIGGGSTALLAFGSLATQVFQDTIARQINNVITNIQDKKNNDEILKEDIKETERFGKSEGYDQKVITKLVDNKIAIQGYYDIMNQGEINAYNNIIKTVAAQEQQTVALQKSKEAGEKFKSYLEQIPGIAKDLQRDLGETAETLKMKAEEAGQTITQNWRFNKISQDSAGFIQSMTKAFDDLNKGFGGTQAFQNMDSFKVFRKAYDDIMFLDSGIQPTQEQLENLFITWRNFTKELTIQTGNVAVLDETNSKLDLTKAKLQASEDSAKNFRNQIEQLATVRSFTQLVSGIGQFAAGLRGVINLTKVWKNENLSVGEKVLQTFTNLSMTIPMLMNSYNKLKTASLILLGSEAKKEAAKLKTLELQTKQKEKQIALGKLAELQANPMSTLAERETAEKAFQGLVEETGKLKGEINVLNNQSKDFFGLLSAKIPEILGFLGSVAPILIGVGAIAAGIFLAYKEWNKEADAAKKASEVATDAKKTYDDLKTSLQDIKSALEDLHSAEDNLDGLTKGTQEWRDALQQCNDKVLELISNYPELAQYVTNENGQLKLSADGEQAYLNRLQAGVQNARNASYIASSESREADVNAAAADIGHNSSYGANTAGKSGGYASAEQVKTVVQAIDKIIGEGADLKSGLGGLADEIVKQTGQNEELVKAILSNEDAVLQLRTQLQQNETADKLMYETMAQGALADNSTFKGMDELGQQVASAIGGADLESKVQQIEADLMKTMTDGIAIWSGSSNQQVKEILNQLNNAQGTNWKLDSNAVRGTDGNRTFAFLDQMGQLHTYTKQQIASTIAAKEALENLGASAEDASKVLASIDSKVSDTAKDAVKQWIAGQDVTDINRSGLENLQNQYKDLEKLFSQDELKSIAEARGIDTQNNQKWQEQLEKDWDNSLQHLSSSFDNVAQEASNSVKQAWSSIDEDGDIAKSTLSTQKAIVENMQKAFAQGGKKGLEDITNFFSKTEDLDKLNSLDFDFTKGSVEDFKNALEEAGIQTRANTDQLQAYINAKKEESEIISSEQNYKSVHGITDKLKEGDIIDEEQADILRQAGININNYFTKMADGSLKLIQDAQKFQYHVNQISLQPLEQEWNSLRDRLNKAGEFEQGEYSASNPNMRWEDFSKTAASSQTYGGAEVATEQNRKLLQAQIELLDIIGQKNDHIAEIQEKIHNNEAIGIEDYRKVSEALQNHQQDWEGLNEKQQEYFSRMQQLSEEMANIRLIPVDEDVDTEALQNLTDYLYEEADALEGVDDGLTQNRQAAEEVAESILRYDSALEEVIDKYDEWTKMLSSDNIQDNIQAGEQLQNVYADLLDLPFENLSPDFTQSTENLELLKQAANGSEQAYNELLERAQQDIESNISLDNSQFWTAKGEVEAAMDEMNFESIQIGANLDTGDFLNQLTDMVNAAGMSAEQATDYLASMGVDAVVKENTATTEETQESIGYVPTRVLGEPLSQDITYLGSDGLPHEGHVNYQAAGYIYEPQPISETATKESKAFSLEVTSAHKKSGGGFKYQNASHGGGSKGGSGKKSGGGKKGGGGGGGKAKEPNKAKGATNKADRYRNNTVKANKLANSMTKLQKQQERLTGKDSLKNLQKQLQILKKQNDTIRERIGLQRDEQKQLANNLKKSGATFDKDGTLNNYFKVHANIMKKYNDAVAKWNKMSADQQQKNKEYLNNAKTEMDNALKDLQRYDKLQQEIAKSIQQQIDNAQAQIDNQVKQFEIKIDAELDLSKVKRDWNEFRKNIIEETRDDDILGLNNFRFADIASYYNSAQTGSIKTLSDQLQRIIDSSKPFSTTYQVLGVKQPVSLVDEQARIEQIQNLMDKLGDQMEGFKELMDEIKESIFDAIDAAQDAFDEQMDEYEFLGDLIDHNMKVVELMFGDEAYDKMANYYDRMEENNNNQLDFLRQQKDLWYSRMVEEQARMNQIAQQQGQDSNRYKESKAAFEEYKKHWMDSIKDLNSMVQDSLDNIINKYANTIDNIILKFNLSLGNGRGLDDIEDEWDMLNQQADMFLDKINSAYQIEKLQNAFDDAIRDNEGDLNAQQSLNDLMEQQLAYLRDKEKLTQYDVDRANTLLQIEMKRLALEQSRANKNRLRLRRDSQGNYTYQYTADTQAMNKAEQDLAQARNSLYNSDKAAYVDNLNAIQKSANNIKEKLEDIWKDQNLSKEQKLQKSYQLEKYYGQEINDLIAENASIRNNLMDSSFEDLARMYGISIDEFRAMSQDEQNNLFKSIIPQANSLAAQMVEGLAEAGGFTNMFQDILEPLTQAYDDRTKSIAEMEKQSQTNLEEIVHGTDVVITQAQKLLDNNDALIDSYEKELNYIQNTINAAQQLADTYDKVRQAAIAAMTSAYEAINQPNMEIVGTTKEREAAAAQRQQDLLNTWREKVNSAGDIKDFVPYSPGQYSSSYAAMYESSGVEEKINNNSNIISNHNDSALNNLNLNMDNISDTIDKKVFNINNYLETLIAEEISYHNYMKEKSDNIEKAIIANQNVHIDADFPNAKDVNSIVQAINNLALLAAQKANKNN